MFYVQSVLESAAVKTRPKGKVMFDPQKLFVYGALQDAECMLNILGRLPSDPFWATLEGYRRFNTSRGYPVALPEKGASIKGILWSALPMDMIERLDDDEGGLGNIYDRIKVTVMMDAGFEETAWFYVGIFEYWCRHLLMEAE